MKKYRYIFTIFLFFSLTAEAKSLLFSINHQESTVYLLGSIHLAKPELYPLDNEIIQAYKKSEIVVVELDPSTEESMKSVQDSMLSAGRYPEGKSLSTELSAKTYTALEDYMNKAGLSISEIQGLRPWMVMLKLSMEEMIRLGYSPDLGIDSYFLDQAKSDNKTIISLETAEEQMALLSKDNRDFQDKLLRYTLESMDEMEPILNDMFTYWKTGNAVAFEKIMSVPLETDPELIEIYKDLIISRNHTMTEKIEGFLKTGKSYFIIVGSGHVIGKEGIVELLRQKGYQPTQR